MLLSMTGFGSKTVSLPVKKGAEHQLGAERRRGEEMSLVVEIKSLNSRFFESVCKMPSSLGFLEIPIVNLIKEKLIRGRVFIFVKMSGNGGYFERVVPVTKIIKDYFDAVKKVKKDFSIKGDLQISDIVTLPNAFSFDQEEVGKSVEQAILKVVGQVVEQVIKTRAAEGDRLQKDLEKRFVMCKTFIDKIKKLFDEFMKEKKAEAEELLVKSKSGDQEAEKQLTECYELLNKIDVHEEIVRFNSHLNSVEKLLQSKESEKGKRFDFTLQELGREINTIAAKCSNFGISSVAVDVKVELEKVREQVQNIV